MRLYYSD